MAIDPDKTPVAQDVFTYCTREKIETWHVVRNHNVSGIVDRVVCKSCGSEHRYRSKKIVPLSSSSNRVIIRGSGTSQKPTSTSKASEALEETWFSSIKKWGDKSPLTYNPEQCFAPGEVIHHPAFGKGVIQCRRENKVEVLFKDSIKILPSKK